jgi:hypothetical protein
MLWSEITREAWRNITVGTTHALRWALILAVTVGALAWLDTATIRGVVTDAVAYIDGGGATWTISAAQIDGDTCDALAETDGITASGGLRYTRNAAVPLQLPRAQLSFTEATPGFLKLLGAPVNQGVAVTDKVAEQLGTSVPGVLNLSTGDVPLGAVFSYPPDGRTSGLGYTVVALSDTTEPFDECWAVVWPNDQSKTRLLHLSVIPVDNNDPDAEKPIIRQLNPTFALNYSPTNLYNERITKWLIFASLAAGTVIGAAATLTRRLEHAAALHCGVDKQSLLLQAVLETASWTLLAATLITPVILWTAHTTPADSISIAWLGIRNIITGAVGTILGTTLATLTIKERQLFTLFKNR